MACFLRKKISLLTAAHLCKFSGYFPLAITLAVNSRTLLLLQSSSRCFTSEFNYFTICMYDLERCFTFTLIMLDN